jgi:transcriptional regulator with XRE-family HTH domain
MVKIEGFDVVAYKRRLRLLREIVSGENQNDFAERIGIDMKRWNNYERGYPIPREVAFILHAEIPGVSIEWIWWGMTGNLSQSFIDRLKMAEQVERERSRALVALDKAKARVAETKPKRRKSA